MELYSMEDGDTMEHGETTLISSLEPSNPLPSQETTRRRRRHQHASQVNADIKKNVEWAFSNKLQFNVQKTQAITLTRKEGNGGTPNSRVSFRQDGGDQHQQSHVLI
nr:unnamed protein product [Callosobruchus analis]